MHLTGYILLSIKIYLISCLPGMDNLWLNFAKTVIQCPIVGLITSCCLDAADVTGATLCTCTCPEITSCYYSLGYP